MAKNAWVTAYIGLGANIGTEEEIFRTLTRAVEKLDEGNRVFLTATSRAIKTPPWGDVNDQSDFYNMAVQIRTNLSPEELLARCQEIEVMLGRKPGVHWGPRAIDLDILLYGEQSVDLPNLVIPHLYLLQRSFMWGPVLELDPLVKLPCGHLLSDHLMNNVDDKKKK